MKQMAQAVTLDVAGVQELRDDVEVAAPAALLQTGVEGRHSLSSNRVRVHEW
jgi:hypothetical protein